MTISYTTNFNWPLLDDAAENAGAVFNAILVDLDLETKAAQTPIILTTGEIVISKRLGKVLLKRFDNGV